MHGKCFMKPRKFSNPGWKPIAIHRWSPMIHRSPTSGNISCCVQNIAKIVTRTCNQFVDSPAFTPVLSALIFCLFCLSNICSAGLPIAACGHAVPNSLCCCRFKFFKILNNLHNEIMTIKKSTFSITFQNSFTIHFFKTSPPVSTGGQR